MSQIATHARSPRARQIRAWGVHLLTASGAVWGLLAVGAIVQEQWAWAFTCMAAAVLIDGVDGTLARRFRVQEVLPGFDGSLLDNLVDYVNYTLVPAFFLYRAELLPGPYALPAAGLICLVSCYQFCQIDAKTADHYFRGFPSYWNVVVFYLFVLGWSPWANLAAIALLCVLVFLPIKYVYPTRTREGRRLTMPLTLTWGVLVCAIVAEMPNPAPWMINASLLYVAYYGAASLYLTLQPQAYDLPRLEVED